MSEQASNLDRDAAPQWIDTATAAALLGVTERAIQKRAQSGKIPARRVAGKRGEKWEIEARTVQNQARTRENRKGEKFAEQHEPDDEQGELLRANKPNSSPLIGELSLNHAHLSPNIDDEPKLEQGEQKPEQFGEQREQKDAAQVAQLRTELENARAEVGRERELNGFFRGLIEQRDRDAAELRAALREALKAMPKAFTSGTPEAAPTASESPPAHQNRADEQTRAALDNGPKIALETPDTSAADFDEIASLIQKVFG